jgi:nitric-oxide synthase
MKGVSNDVFSKAESFLRVCYQEMEMTEKLQTRLEEVKNEIHRSGTYYHTIDELTHGARMAWRNSNRCVGRLYWKTLKVIDARHLSEEDDIFSALEHHIQYAFNNGKIRSTITVFRQKLPNEKEGPRILNQQLIHFAGHLQEDGSVIGDPVEIDFTEWCKQSGHVFENTSFEVLPHAIQWPGRDQRVKKITLPEGIIIPISHPEYEWFQDLGLFWYTVPIISEMMLEIGGICYTAAPFNGWYMVTEIGSRNFGDAHRYNMLPVIANKIGLDTKKQNTLWKDRAILELNRAVLHSYEKAGASISSHHESSEQFIQFEESEQRRGREVTADWIWIAPPMSTSSLKVFHKYYENTILTPNYFYQDPVIGKPKPELPYDCPFHSKSLQNKD